jgi:5-enolpyruvylshikimate-3-phosphate synthase
LPYLCVLCAFARNLVARKGAKNAKKKELSQYFAISSEPFHQGLKSTKHFLLRA